MKRKITIEIELENAAFDEEPSHETARILSELATNLKTDGFLMTGVENDLGASAGLWDINGNWCGHWRAILDDRADFDPSRWAMLSEAELQTLRTAINIRLCQLHAGGRECDCQEEKESLMLGELDRSMNREIERRNS